MPWKPSDAKRHTKKADNSKKQRQWSDVADFSTLPRGFRGLRDPSSQFGHRQGDDEEEKLSPAARPARCCGAAHATRVWLHRTSKIRMRFAQGSWRQDADANRRCLRALRMIASGVAVFAAWVKARAVTSALFFAALMATAQTARELV